MFYFVFLFRKDCTALSILKRGNQQPFYDHPNSDANCFQRRAENLRWETHWGILYNPYSNVDGKLKVSDKFP